MNDDIILIPDPPNAELLVNTAEGITSVETSAETVHLSLRPSPFQEFIDRIKQMNQTFELECNDKPTDLGHSRLYKFQKILLEELKELDDCYISAGEDDSNSYTNLVALADVLGDLIVYITSEAQRWGIPIVPVLHAIMDSQDSKLVDGKPLKAPDNSKFIKGPDYQPPEPAIKRILWPED